METRRQFSREFKLEVVRHECVLRNGSTSSRVPPKQAFQGTGVMKPEQAEIERLRMEVAKLKMERDIMKKAAAYLAKGSM